MLPKWIETENETRGRWIERLKTRVGLYHSSHFHHFCIWLACFTVRKQSFFYVTGTYTWYSFRCHLSYHLTISLPFNFYHAMLSKFKRHASSCIDHIYWVKRKNMRRFCDLAITWKRLSYRLFFLLCPLSDLCICSL